MDLRNTYNYSDFSKSRIPRLRDIASRLPLIVEASSRNLEIERFPNSVISLTYVYVPMRILQLALLRKYEYRTGCG